MFRKAHWYFLALIACLPRFTVGQDERPRNELGQVLQPLFAKHCLRCHGLEGEINGQVDLASVEWAQRQTTNSQADLQANTGRDLELLRRVIDAVELREMPPEDEPALPEEARQEILSVLRPLLAEGLTRTQTVGQAPMRRMNRAQYNHAVTDLFKLNCVVFSLPESMLREYRDYFRPETGQLANSVVVGIRPLGKSQLIEPRLDGVAPFPQDLRAEHGFDNRGDHLSLSPLLMEAFFKLGQSITHSPDFTAKNVGIWSEFFAPPAAGEDPQQVVRERLQLFLTRAFRRPVPEQTLERYATFVAQQLEQGLEFTEAMRAVAAATIASPKFLYLYDVAGETATSEPLSDLELASRLSFFLWGGLPDRELIELASAGQLSHTQVLLDQVERMLHDKRLKRFCDSFPSQWLQLERIISSLPNPERYPEFYIAKYRVSMHMLAEPLLLFETVLIEDRPITDLIDPDFTYRSHLLHDWYGEEIPLGKGERRRGSEVTTMTFERWPITDRRYGGVITNAAVMTMTSGPNRTQPITRGAWLASVIFNDPPEPPPADVPPLTEKPADGEELLTLREQLVQHRERADCRGCHEQIDPLGFALENYDPVGMWRDRYDNGREVDVAGALFHQHRFDSVVEFKDAILLEKDRFTRGLAGHLLSYALARQLEASDRLAIEKIAKATAEDGYRLQTLIKQVVLSKPFRHKTNPQQALESNVHN